MTISLKGIAAPIREKAGEDWLVIFHETEAKGFDIAKEVVKLLCPVAGVEFTSLASMMRPTSTSTPSVILAGTLFFPTSLLEAEGRCGAAFPSEAGEFAKIDIAEVEIGEHRRRIL